MTVRNGLNVDLPELKFVMRYEDTIRRERIALESRNDVHLMKKIHRCHSLLIWIIDKYGDDCLFLHLLKTASQC